MRKPRDYDAELEALDNKARQLKARKREQLGELVIAIGADALSMEQLAGALLAAEATDERTKEAQRTRGAAFFRAKSGSRQGTRHGDSGPSTDRSSARPASAAPGAA